jgi:hypothetical protein
VCGGCVTQEAVQTSGDNLPSGLPADFLAAHHKVSTDSAIQFTLDPMPTFLPPEWLNWLRRFGADWFGWVPEFFRTLSYLGTPIKFVFWGLVGAVVLTILLLILRQFTGFEFPWRKRPVAEDDTEWTADAMPARQLLAEADALAAAGRYEEAAHLLLLRSVENIAESRATFLRPASTSREIARAEALPAKARSTFARIAAHVEASLFGGAKLDATSWADCRDAYRDFAGAGQWQ